jgi:Uma2 family endonuclease
MMGFVVPPFHGDWMSTAYRYLPEYTVDDYQQWQGDWELWQGIPISMTPSPYGRHQQVAARLLTTLQNEIDRNRCDAVVLGEIDWIVSDNTVVRPDLSVLCGDAPAQHVEDTPTIVAEVMSSSTAQRDRTAKFDLYQDEGVKYYLILDAEKNVLSAFRLDDSGKYVPHEFGEEITLNVCDDCQLRFPVANLFASATSS